MDEAPKPVGMQADALASSDFGVAPAARAGSSEIDSSWIGRVWNAVNRRPGGTLWGLIALYLAIVCGQGATKLLWGDELITLAIANQGTWARIWRALADGADPNPPLTHGLVLLSTRLLGQSALAVRLPAILCVLLAIVCLWGILRRWLQPGYAAVGVLALMATRGFDYAYDARSYAALLGFSMASLALWLRAGDSPDPPHTPDAPDASRPRRWRRSWRRPWALAGMAATLALGVSSNYYGVLAFFPIAIGEAVRLWRARQLRLGVWLALAVAALPLLAYRPLIRHNLAEFAPHAWNRPQAGMVVSSYVELVEGVFWPVLLLGLFAASEKKPGRKPEPEREQKRRPGESVSLAAAASTGESASAPPPGDTLAPQLRPHESAAIKVLVAYPFLGLAIAALGKGMISPRCVVPVCCGFAIAMALLCRRVFGRSAQVGGWVLCAMLVWVLARETACAVVLGQQRRAFLALRDAVAAAPAGEPIVVADSLFVLPLAHYSSPKVRARIVFPIDFAAIHRWEADDSGEQNLWAGRNGLFPVRIVAYAAPPAGAAKFLLIARDAGWLAQRLTEDGIDLNSYGPPTSAWQDLGGVFTPMDHDDTRLLEGQRLAASR